MKTLFIISILLCPNLVISQSKIKDTTYFMIRKSFDICKKNKLKFIEIENSKDIFLYKNEDKYSYYDRKIYDSLTRKGVIDSIKLSQSLLKLQLDSTYAVKYRINNFKQEIDFILWFKNNVPISKERISNEDNYNSYYKEDYQKKISFVYFFDEKKEIIYEFSKYGNVIGHQLHNLIYKKIYFNSGKIVERNYDKDFTLSEKELLKNLPTKFYKQVPTLMNGKRYFHLQNDIPVEGRFNTEDAKTETEQLKMLIKSNKVYVYKIYNDKQGIPFYRVTFSSSFYASWELLVNPKTGNIENVDFKLLEE